LFGKANANGVGAVIENHRGCSRLAFQNRRGVDGDFLGSEARARGNRRIHLVGYGWTADGIFDAIQTSTTGWEFEPILILSRASATRGGGFIEELARPGKKA